MTSIIIKGAAAATEAGEWCMQHFINSDWDMQLKPSHAFSEVYTFVFTKQHDATLFALKWR